MNYCSTQALRTYTAVDTATRSAVPNGPPHPEAQLPQEMLPFSASAGRDVADAPPTRGVWAAGAILRATTPTKALAGWVCTVGGTPGTWEAFGLA